MFITLTSIVVLAVGIALTINEVSKIDIEADVSQKYNMTTKYDTYNMPGKNEKMYITFNSNYDTQYIVKYDNKLDFIQEPYQVKFPYLPSQRDIYNFRRSPSRAFLLWLTAFFSSGVISATVRLSPLITNRGS